MPRAIDPESLLLERRKERIDQVVERRTRSLTLVLEAVHDPHNLAAVLRTAEGLGLQDVHIVEGPAGFRPSSAVTQGADKWLDIHRHRDALACAEVLRGEGYALFGSRLDEGAVPLLELPLTGKVALIFGNEHQGLSETLAAQCQGFFRIPMAGFTQSFNVSVAVGISLAAAVETRRQKGLNGDLSPEASAELRQRFYALAVKQGHRFK